jgi:hypothetical protein
MNGLLLESLVDYFSTTLNRPVIRPITIYQHFLPVNTHWHTILDGVDTGLVGGTDQMVSDKVFMGRIEVFEGIVSGLVFEPYKKVLPRFASCREAGNIFTMLRSLRYEHGRYVMDGVFALMYCTAVPANGFRVNYYGYVLKAS